MTTQERMKQEVISWGNMMEHWNIGLGPILFRASTCLICVSAPSSSQAPPFCSKLPSGLNLSRSTETITWFSLVCPDEPSKMPCTQIEEWMYFQMFYLCFLEFLRAKWGRTGEQRLESVWKICGDNKQTDTKDEKEELAELKNKLCF